MASEPTQVDESTTVQSFSTWDTPATDDDVNVVGPGSSWEAPPPRDTAVPVSDEMIETLVGGFPTESWEVESKPDETDDKLAEEPQSSVEAPVAAESPSAASPNIDHLLKIARELEYGLIELAETMPAGSAEVAPAGPVDTDSLGGMLAGLTSEDDLKSLRDAVETARERPRDVDVMLDLVLRAEAIATVINERDRLIAAIEAATGAATAEAAESDEPGPSNELDAELGDATEELSEASPYAST